MHCAPRARTTNRSAIDTHAITSHTHAEMPHRWAVCGYVGDAQVVSDASLVYTACAKQVPRGKWLQHVRTECCYCLNFHTPKLSPSTQDAIVKMNTQRQLGFVRQ